MFIVRHHLNIKAERTETVVATDHGTHGILHPSVIEIAFTFRQRLDKRFHRLPGRRTHPFRTLSADGNPLLPHPDIARMLYRVLISRHQVGIDSLADGCDAYLVHNSLSPTPKQWLLVIVPDAKVILFCDIRKFYKPFLFHRLDHRLDELHFLVPPK